MPFEAVDNPAWRPYLFGWRGDNYSKCIVRFERKYWFVKCFPDDSRSAQRERLAYLLGRKFTNIAEVRLLSEADFFAVSRCGVELPEAATRANTYLVRMGFDYSWLRLPIKTLEHAVAAELVFSLWIRRRDAHSFNRIYVRGIPVFFDHQTGILGEPELIDMERFFFEGPDAGYAAWWQLEEKRSMRSPDILSIRRQEKNMFSAGSNQARVIHQVRQKERLKKRMAQVQKRIRSIPTSYFYAAALKSGFDERESREVAEFLRTTTLQLEKGVERLSSMFGLT